MKVCFFLDNPYTRDTRIIKQCESLVELGFDVSVVCTWRQGFKQGLEKVNGVKVYRLSRRLSDLPKQLALLRTEKNYNENSLLVRAIKVTLPVIKVGMKLKSRLKGAVKQSHANEELTVSASIAAENASVQQAKPVAKSWPQCDQKNKLFSLKGMVKVLFVPCYVVLLPWMLLSLLVHSLAFTGRYFSLKEALDNQVEFSSRNRRRLVLNYCCLVPWLLCVPGMFVYRIFKRFSYVKFDLKSRYEKLFWQDVAAFKYFIFSPHFIISLLFGLAIDANFYQANDPPTVLLGVLTAKLRRAKLIYDSHELYDESFPARKPLLLRAIVRKLEQMAGHSAYRMITVNESIAKLLRSRYHLKVQPLVIRNVQKEVEAHTIDAKLSETLAAIFSHAVFSPSESRLKLIYAGKLTQGRGIEESIAALQFMNDQAVLILMGHATKQYKSQLKSLVAELELDGKVLFFPAVASEEVELVCQKVDLGLMLTETTTLSYYYGLGNKFFHYVMSGIPVLVPDQPEKRAAAEQYNVGWVVDEVSAKAIAAKLKQLVNDPDQIAEKKKSCQQVMKQLSWKAESEAYTEVYVRRYEEVLFANEVYT